MDGEDDGWFDRELAGCSFVEERTKCCVTGIDRDSLSGTDSREERCRWTGKTTDGLIASLLAAVLWRSAQSVASQESTVIPCLAPIRGRSGADGRGRRRMV